MPTAPTLLELQHRLEALLSLGGAPGFEADLERAAPALPITGDDRLTPPDRLAIYTRMIFVRIRDAVAEDFPATFATLGADAWEAIVARYLEAHPTNHPDLRLAGRFLPEFTRRTEASTLADLVALEWALADSFTAADAARLDAQTLQVLPVEAWPELPVRTVPSLRLLAPTSPADHARRDLLAGKATTLAPCDRFYLRVWRRELRVFLKRVDLLEHDGLQLASHGVSFAGLCAWISEREPERDAAEVAVGLLQTWLAEELLVAIP